MFITSLLPLVVVVLMAASVGFVSAQTSWQAEWDRTVRAAEAEGQLTLYGCCYDYDRVLEGFRKKYPTLKVALVLSGGNQLATRILAERRGENISSMLSARAPIRCMTRSTRRKRSIPSSPR